MYKLNEPNSTTNPRIAAVRSGRCRRRGLTLLLCLCVITISSLAILGILNTQMAELSATRNTNDYERAMYLSGAGIHHALTEVEQLPTWRGTIPVTEFPPGSGATYTAVVADDLGGNVLVTSTGVSGSVTQKLEVLIHPGG